MNRLRCKLFQVGFLLLLGFTFSLWFPPRSVAQQTESVSGEQALLNITIMNGKGDYIWDLDKSMFALFEGKVRQGITSFRAEDIPVSIGVVLDASGSMQLEDSRIKLIPNNLREMLSQFVKRSHEANEYFVIGFNRQPQLIADWTNNEMSVANAVTALKPKGQTSLYDACYLGVEKLAQAKHQKRVLFLLTDGGEDNASKHKQSELQKLLQRRTDVLLYAVVFSPSPQNIFDGGKALDELARMTGGRAFFTQRVKDLNVVFSLIALELRHQYLLGFTSASDGKKHRVKIKLTPPSDAPRQLQKVSIRSREEYLATKD